MLRSTFPGKRLASASRPGKRKSWFDHNEIIRGYVYASSVVHATEIHLHSLIGARTCKRVYTNSAELDAQSEQDISKLYAEKYICEQKLTTCAYRLPDNYVVISEHRKSYYWKTSVQTSQKMGFGKITPQSRVCRNTFC